MVMARLEFAPQAADDRVVKRADIVIFERDLEQD